MSDVSSSSSNQSDNAQSSKSSGDKKRLASNNKGKRKIEGSYSTGDEATSNYTSSDDGNYSNGIWPGESSRAGKKAFKKNLEFIEGKESEEDKKIRNAIINILRNYSAILYTPAMNRAEIANLKTQLSAQFPTDKDIDDVIKYMRVNQSPYEYFNRKADKELLDLFCEIDADRNQNDNSPESSCETEMSGPKKDSSSGDNSDSEKSSGSGQK